ncbi:MAG: EI24 domain-containing protein, partial [Burkholderiales bacterium]|nr:EI24 domain-containing protein [Burkholderiales bacterium]
FAAKILVFLMFVPLVWLTALLILSVFGMPVMVEHVASRRFAQLARRRGGTLAGSIWNGVVAVAGLIGLALLSIPFWLLPPLWPLIPVAIMGWLNQRVLRYDALAEHASGEEMLRIFSARRGTLYWMGVVLALLAYVPLVGFLAPVLFGLAFIHLLLGELQGLRGAPIEGEVVGRETPSALR